MLTKGPYLSLEQILVGSKLFCVSRLRLIRLRDLPMTKPPIALEKRVSEDGRLFSPSAGRNKAIIASVLAESLPKAASVLEIGSGTGEHGIETLGLQPDLDWHFSDPDLKSRESQAAWIRHSALDLAEPQQIDVTKQAWWSGFARPFDVLFSANMIHIAPITALEGLAEGASQILTSKGQVFLYGPFLFEDASAPSNLEFDLSLKRRNSAWGVREIEFVKHIFAKHGFNRVQLRDMPKNNHLLGLSRD